MASYNVIPLSVAEFILVAFMILTVWTAPLHGTTYVCPSGWTMYSSSCYYVETQAYSWSDASTLCVGYGARLAEITTDDENSFIINDIGEGLGLWIDCTDAISEGDWLCGDDNHPMSYTNWRSGEPTNSGGNEDCIAIEGGAWNDIYCGAGKFVVCKKDAEQVVAKRQTKSFRRDGLNYCLKNNIIETIKPSTLIDCAGLCLMSDDCASFNYIEMSEVCELNNITRKIADDSEFMWIAGCTYYDIDS